jgi:hypothetical protein
MATTTAEERAEAAKMRSGEGGRSQATGAVDMARFPPVEIEVRVGAASQRSHAQTRAIARLPRGHAGDASCTVWLPVSTRMRMWGMRSVCENRAAHLSSPVRTSRTAQATRHACAVSLHMRPARDSSGRVDVRTRADCVVADVPDGYTEICLDPAPHRAHPGEREVGVTSV